MFIESGKSYPQLPLKQLCTKIGSGATPRGGKSAYQNYGITLIRSTNVFDYKFSYNDLAHITEEQAKQLLNVIVEPGDVLFNITGVSVARCCVVQDDVIPARVNQHVMILRPTAGRSMSYYVMTTLCSSEYKTKLLGIAQSGSTREAINKQEMEEFMISVPPDAEIKTFGMQASKFYNSIAENMKEIRQLDATQSVLLSQLSSR
jgi:type I restriction enzyme S subunit